MTPAIEPDPADPADPAPTPPPHRRAARTLVILTAAGLAVAATAWAWHWHTHPTALERGGAGWVTTLDKTPSSLYTGLTFPRRDPGATIEIETVTPRIIENSTGATFDYYLCSLDTESVGFDALGTVDRRGFEKFCPDAVPVEPLTNTLHTGTDPAQQLVVAITTGQRGVIRLDGFDVTYTHGWQRGTQTVGDSIKIRAR